MPQCATTTRRISHVSRQSVFTVASTMPSQQKAPEKRVSSENMKQKSLINFFGKSGAKPTNVSTPAPKSVPSKPTRPQLARGSASSDVESSAKDTPPTSDPIDVDMLPDEQPVKTPRGKSVRTQLFSHTTLFHFHASDAS